MAFRSEMTVDELKHRITQVDAEVIMWNRGTARRRMLVNEKMQLQAELIRRRQLAAEPKPPALVLVAPPRDMPVEVLRPCSFCGAETVNGRCTLEGPDYPHPRDEGGDR